MKNTIFLKRLYTKPRAFLLILLMTCVLSACGMKAVSGNKEQEITQQHSDSVLQNEQSDSISQPLSVSSAEETEKSLDNPSEKADEQIQGAETEIQSEELVEPEKSYDFTICFAGDVNFHESWCNMLYMKKQERGILDCISPELVEAMNDADIMCLNNEFTYSNRGEALAGKTYHFRAKPERVQMLEQLGVDVVTLANNHVYDYGKNAFLDTLETLEQAGIGYFGAGRNLEEAMTPFYVEIQGKKIAFVGASRAEKNKKTPQATDTQPGILRCYDTTLFEEAIANAKANADFCIAVVHWGTEYTAKVEPVQTETGRLYLDAGADAVIGAHSHCLQGIEYYQGKPIIYSLGNFWFNEKTLDTMLLQLHFTEKDGESQMSVQVIPAVQEGYKATYASDEKEQRRIYDYLENISVNVTIDDSGMVQSISKE